MKLVIGGSTGLVATELIRQGLDNPSITSIVALGRREIPVPLATSKLKFVVCDNFESYPNSVKKELEDADACIWYAYLDVYFGSSSLWSGDDGTYSSNSLHKIVLTTSNIGPLL
jgi:hypothetical protein